jgi:MYXO-CTERM domain-containing protein
VSFPPRIASVSAVALAATLLLGPLGAAPARPAPTATVAPLAQAAHVAPVAHAISAPHDALTLTHVGVKLLLERLGGVQPPRVEDAVRSLCVLAVTMSLSPVDVWYVKPQSNQTEVVPPVDHPPPGIPPPPVQPQSQPEESPPPPPPPIRVPEPATVTSALIGASLAGLAWLRRRRRGKATTDEAPDADSPPPDGE